MQSEGKCKEFRLLIRALMYIGTQIQVTNIDPEYDRFRFGAALVALVRSKSINATGDDHERPIQYHQPRLRHGHNYLRLR